MSSLEASSPSTIAFEAQSPIASDPAVLTPSEYLRQAASGDEYEIRSSELLLRMNPPSLLRDYATKMIGEHTASTRALTNAAMKLYGIVEPSALDEEGLKAIHQLLSLSGINHQTDIMYIYQQILAHKRALLLHEEYARAGTQPELVALAQELIPTVKQHLDEIKNIEHKLAWMNQTHYGPSRG
jgi:putative membrane protein